MDVPSHNASIARFPPFNTATITTVHSTAPSGSAAADVPNDRDRPGTRDDAVGDRHGGHGACNIGAARDPQAYHPAHAAHPRLTPGQGRSRVHREGQPQALPLLAA